MTITFTMQSIKVTLHM